MFACACTVAVVLARNLSARLDQTRQARLKAHLDWVNPAPQTPRMTTLFGDMVVGKERVHVHYRTARLPDGNRIPVCIVLGLDERSGVLKEPGKEPGTYQMPRGEMFTVVRRFEKPY